MGGVQFDTLNATGKYIFNFVYPVESYTPLKTKFKLPRLSAEQTEILGSSFLLFDAIYFKATWFIMSRGAEGSAR